ncbi:hypothetical protein [Rhizobium johnstonii]|uniref:hypothetical protein n=1 Tax=Rhizobium johnstonii TaxID=3019933 RepID=UPI003F977047
MSLGRRISLYFIVFLKGLALSPAHANEAQVLKQARNNEAFNLAVSMTSNLAMCDFSASQRRDTDRYRISALDVAAQELKVPLAEMKQIVGDFSGKVAQYQISNGTKEASCAYHRAWLMGQ